MEMKPIGNKAQTTQKVTVEVPVVQVQAPIAKKKRKGFIAHLASIGFTNRMACQLILMLWAGLGMSFILAFYSIRYQYMGALACWTVVFTPIGTACSIVLGAVVHKNKAENTAADGEGIVFASAKSKDFNNQNEDYQQDSPPI